MHYTIDEIRERLCKKCGYEIYENEKVVINNKIGERLRELKIIEEGTIKGQRGRPAKFYSKNDAFTLLHDIELLRYIYKKAENTEALHRLDTFESVGEKILEIDYQEREHEARIGLTPEAYMYDEINMKENLSQGQFDLLKYRFMITYIFEKIAGGKLNEELLKKDLETEMNRIKDCETIENEEVISWLRLKEPEEYIVKFEDTAKNRRNSNE